MGPQTLPAQSPPFTTATLIYMPAPHQPVLAEELSALLAPEPGQVAIDCTFGAGGHAAAIAAQLGPGGTLICIDRDPSAATRFAEFAAAAPCRTRFLGSDFAEGLHTLRGEGIHPEMIYLDLGMSSMQIDAWERGFSYAYDAPLDMRMDTRQALSAAEILNEWPQSRISEVLRRFGEERYAGGIAGEIVRRRPLHSTAELVAAVKAGMPGRGASSGGGHPASRHLPGDPNRRQRRARLLEDALPLAWEMLTTGGRLAAISFHSLEDRRVKQFLTARARAASVRRSYRFAFAATSPRRSCSPAARSALRPRRLPRTPARAQPICERP